MRSYFVWPIFSVLAAVALWLLQAGEPGISALAIGLFLLLLGGIAGLRWGADSADRAIKEMAQLNKYLAEQNQDLAETNHLLLKQFYLDENLSQENTSQSTAVDDDVH